MDQQRMQSHHTPGTVTWQTRINKARLTKRGQEDQLQIKGCRLARRLYDFGCWEGRKVKHVLCQTWDDTVSRLGFDCTLDHALHHPLVVAAELRAHMSTRQERQKKQMLYAWQKGLAEKGRPTGKMFRWLRSEQAVTSPTLKVEDQHVTKFADILREHRVFWETIGTRQDLGQPEIPDILQGLGSATPISAAQVLAAAQMMQGKAVAGLDRWAVHALQNISREDAQVLASLFSEVEATGCWPYDLSAVRVAFIPKPGSDAASVKGWRPIAITSALYRLYGKIRLPDVMAALGPGLHPGVIGGLPGDHASGQVLRMATYSEAFACGLCPSVVGISLDASKCFDRIDWAQVAQLACDEGVNHGIIRAVLGFYTSHARYASLGGRMDGVPWVITRGLLQGCSLSVAFTLSLVSRWHYVLGNNLKTLSFVDDRIILARCGGDLSEGWQASQQWDREHGWQVNTAKTVGFVLGEEFPALNDGDDRIEQHKTFKYLGNEIHMANHQPRIVLLSRVATIRALCVESVSSHRRLGLMRWCVRLPWLLCLS